MPKSAIFLPNLKPKLNLTLIKSSFLLVIFVKEIKSLKYQKRPNTEHPLNHVSYIGRSSKGHLIPHSSFENLIKFSMEWRYEYIFSYSFLWLVHTLNFFFFLFYSEFPDRLTHIVTFTAIN